MKKIKQKLHSCMATIIMCSMIQTSYAAGAQANPWANAASAITQTMQSYINQRGQNINQQMQQAAMARQQQMMSSMQPQMGPAQFFPECPVLQRISNMPENVCEASSINPSDVGQMMGIQSMAKMASKEYEKSMLGSLECIANRQKVFDSQLIDFQNSLKKMQDQLKQDSQVFRDNTNQMMSDMKSNWADLNGAGTSVDAKTGDFTKQFSPTCATFLRGNKIDNKGGLLGMMDATKDANILSANFSQARPQIEAGIINDGNQLSAAIKNGGLDAVDLNNVSADNKVAIEAIIKTESAAYQKTVERLNKDINFDPAFNVGSMDGTYSSGAEANISNALANFKNSRMRDCMAGKSGATLNDGIKIDGNTINSLITQAGTDGGTAAPGYRNAIMQIMNNNDLNVTLEMKINQIKALEKTYKNMVFNSTVGGQSRSEPASQAFARLASDCETFYTQPSANGGMSPQQFAQKAQTAMRELKNAHDALGDKIAQSISSKLISCSGNQSNGTRACTPDMITPNAPGFCVATANKCAGEIQGCYGEISAKVGMKTAKIKNLGLQYNAAASQMIARANQLFTQQKAAVGALLANIKTKYPGMNFVIGDGKAGGQDDPLMISSPAVTKSEFGIDLIAGGNMEEYLKELPKKIGSLQAIIAEQQAKAKEQVDAYINGAPPVKGLTAYLEESKGKWDKLAGQCKSMVDQSMQQIAEANKKNEEDYSKVVEFCTKYSAFSTSPDPLCDGAEDLTTDMGKIVSRINPDARKLATQAKNFCAKANNEATAASDSVPTFTNAMDFCKNKANTSDDDLLKAIRAKKQKVKDTTALAGAADVTFNTQKTSAANTLETAKNELKEAEVAQKYAEEDLAEAEKILKNATDKEEKETDAAKKAALAIKTAAAETKKEDAKKAKRTADATVKKKQRIIEEKPAVKAGADSASSGDSICKRLYDSYPENQTGEKASEKDAGNKLRAEAMSEIIKSAVNASKTTDAATSDKLDALLGQMASTPCTGIASTPGKGGLLPWERPPEAGIGSLGSTK